ncbi:hypothetical protein J6I39_00105 [bacterium]|nr:hypothetical protein [bacterium]
MVVKLDLTQVRRSNGGQVITNGKLGKQAKKVVRQIQEFVSNQERYNVGVSEKPEQKAVVLSLMTRSYGENGYEVLHNRMLKSKGATETYQKAIQDMIKNEENLIAERRTTHKASQNNTDGLDEILEVNGKFWNSVGKVAQKGISKVANFVQSAVGLR